MFEEKITGAAPVEAAGAPCGGECESCEACPAAVQPAVRDESPVTVADICFREEGKPYYFDPGELKLKPGDNVIMDTARGPEFGICTAGNHTVRAFEVVQPLRKILRLATPQDEKQNQENRELEKKACEVCAQKIAEHRLDMQLVSAECAFDGSKLLFYFTADGRVDFRELVKNLASVFHTRIELRQIGVRDKAKMVGGLGICGRPFCCREFLADFQPVSIKMAKTQNLSLNPTKISGTCGRLMCCLKYEQDAYEDLLRTVPKPESFVDTPGGRGTVTDVNLLRQTVRVRMEKTPDTFANYSVDEIYVIRSGKAKKTDPPIPEDFAPISAGGAVRRPAAADPMPEVAFRSRAARPAAQETAQTLADGAEAPAASEPRPQNRGRRRGGRPDRPAQGSGRPEQNDRPAQAPAKPAQAPKKPEAAASDTTEKKEQDRAPRPQNRNYRRRRRPSPQGGETPPK